MLFLRFAYTGRMDLVLPRFAIFSRRNSLFDWASTYRALGRNCVSHPINTQTKGNQVHLEVSSRMGLTQGRIRVDAVRSSLVAESTKWMGEGTCRCTVPKVALQRYTRRSPIIVYNSVRMLTGWVIDYTGLIADKRMAHVGRGR